MYRDRAKEESLGALVAGLHVEDDQAQDQQRQRVEEVDPEHRDPGPEVHGHEPGGDRVIAAVLLQPVFDRLARAAALEQRIELPRVADLLTLNGKDPGVVA